LENNLLFNDEIRNERGDIFSTHKTTSFRVWMTAKDVMSEDVLTVPANASVVSAAKVMAQSSISCVVVVNNEAVVGILTETDMLRKVAGQNKDFDKIQVTEIMSSPVIGIPPELPVLDVSRIMNEKHIRRLVVIDKGRLAGIITQTDMVRVMTFYGMWKEVSEIMSRDVAVVQKDDMIADAAQIMNARNISCVVVLSGSEVVGVLTEKDMIQKVVAAKKDPTQTTVEQLMTSPVLTVPADHSAFSASRMMQHKRIRRLVVMDNDRLCGIVTQTDIFKAIKNKLQNDEKKNLDALDHSVHNIYTLDANGLITYVNPPFMKLFEVDDSSEFLDQFFLPEKFWVNPEDKALFLSELKKERFELKELALKTAKGSNRYVTIFNIQTRDIHGQINGSQGIIYDVTPHKELSILRETEEMLMQAKNSAEAANEAKNQFISNMNHEIHTPLNAIIGFSDLLADENLTNEQKEYVNLIRASGKSLLKITNDILDFTKIEARKLNIDVGMFPPAQLLNAVEAEIAPKAKAKGIEFRVIENNSLPAGICTDRTLLEQCLTKLAGNAVKFTEKGYVHIKVSSEAVGGKSYIQFDIEDTGIGIPSDKQEKIFEPFVQADGGTTRKFGGTGLGLTIAKKLAELLGGKLTLKSKEGQGTTFSLVIPVRLDAGKQKNAKNDIAGGFGYTSDNSDKKKFSKKILVAAGANTNQILKKLLLDKTDIDIMTAADGNEMVQKAISRKPDLILMDIQIPYMDSYGTMKFLRQEGITMPIVVLTDNGMSDERKYIEAGYDACVSKPLDQVKLMEVINEYLPSEDHSPVEASVSRV
jgi:signal transduction histidine kinase/CBS domain-containing protein/ActR/RegA family two-component response regulator